MGLPYRLWQFWRLVRVQPFPASGWPTVKAVLSPAELELFRRQTPADRTHSLRVLLTLQEAGETNPYLLTAALLHDVGKCRMTPNLWDRVVGAAGERLFPRRAATWGRAEASGWRRPFVIREQHAAWGAEMARLAGSHPTTIRLIGHHPDALEALQDREERQLLARLKWADNQN